MLTRLPAPPPLPDRSRRRRTHFVALASAIVYQQLSGKAAATIYSRVCGLTPGSGFPTPHEVAELADAELSGAGLSRAKTAAVRDLAERVVDGRLKLAGMWRLADEEICERLCEVKGVGEWTAQMFLIFRMGRLDVMPAGDLGVREGVRKLDRLRERPSVDEVLERTQVWRPYRSLGAWAMWRVLELP